MKTYICPNCKEKQDSIIQIQTESVFYKVNLETQEMQDSGLDSVAGDTEGYCCPNCHNDLDVVWGKNGIKVEE